MLICISIYHNHAKQSLHNLHLQVSIRPLVTSCGFKSPTYCLTVKESPQHTHVDVRGQICTQPGVLSISARHL